MAFVCPTSWPYFLAEHGIPLKALLTFLLPIIAQKGLVENLFKAVVVGVNGISGLSCGLEPPAILAMDEALLKHHVHDLARRGQHKQASNIEALVESMLSLQMILVHQ